MNQQTKSFWGRLIDALTSKPFQDYLVDLLERQTIKAVLKKLAITGGFKAWLISFVIGELIEEADEHIIEPLFQKLGFIGDSLDGKKIYKKITEAEDPTDWRDTIGRV